jgi:hypothetical protein
MSKEQANKPEEENENKLELEALDDLDLKRN